MKKIAVAITVILFAATAMAKQKDQSQPQLILVDSSGMARPLKPEDGMKCVLLTIWGGLYCWKEPVKK